MAIMTDLTDLTERDIRLCEAMAFWIEVARGPRAGEKRDDLLSKLSRYANHHDDCPAKDNYEPDSVCNCGFREAERAIEEAKLASLHYGPEWLPTRADIEHSSLFGRIRHGKDPLPYPPPRAYAYPWYEVIEQGEPHPTADHIKFHMEAGRDLQCSILHCLYDCITDPMSDPSGQYVLGYGPYRFRAWSDPVTHRGWIQRALDLEEEPIIHWQQETTELDANARTYVGGQGTFTYAKQRGAILGGRISGPTRGK